MKSQKNFVETEDEMNSVTKRHLTAPCGLDCFRFPHNFKVFNLCRIKAVGVEQWADEEAKLIRQRYFSGKFIPGKGPVLER